MVDLLFSKQDHHLLEANQVLHTNGHAVATWCNGVAVTEINPLDHEDSYVGINVPTADGMVRAQEGDWVVRRITGDFYVAKPDEFEELFDVVK